MQQVGGSVGTAVLSTIVASATLNYAKAHVSAPALESATHGFTAAFATAALFFAVGGILAAALFPSKARLAEMRASAAPMTDKKVMRLETEMLDEFGVIG
jgi:hypothetical protein